MAVTTGKAVQVWERWETDATDATDNTADAPPAGGVDRNVGAAPRWELSATLSGLEGYVNAISFREDGLLLAAVDHQGNVKVWSRESEEGAVEGTRRGLIESAETQGTLWSCSFGLSLSASLLVAGGFSGMPMPTDTAAHSKLQKERVRGGEAAEQVQRGILAVAAMYKASGNAAFKDKKYADGIVHYQGALSLLDTEAFKTAQGDAEVKEEAKELETTCHCNIAACGLNTNEFGMVENHCRTVLADNPNHPKALYRLGMSQMGQDRLDEAEETFNAAKHVMGADDPQLVRALQQVEMSKAWLYFGIGQDGSFVINDSCYQALRQSAPQGKEAELALADFADLITAFHTGELGLTKDADQPPEAAEITNQLVEAIGEDALHLVAWPTYRQVCVCVCVCVRACVCACVCVCVYVYIYIYI